MRAVALGAFCAVFGGLAQAESSAEATAAIYSRALMRADCERLRTLIPKAVTERQPTAPDMYCKLSESAMHQGMSERLRAPTHRLASGQHRLVVIPNTRFAVQRNGQPSLTEGVYVVHSDDGGNHWQVLDMICDHLPKWVQAVYPAYDGSIEFRAELKLLTAS